MVKLGLFVKLQAKPGWKRNWRAFCAAACRLRSRNRRRLPGSPSGWARPPSAFSMSLPTNRAGRRTWTGRIAAALMQKASLLLAEPPKIEKVDVLAAKL